MILTEQEVAFLIRQHMGHLATIGPSGSPQVKPLGFTWNVELGTIDIAGFNMAQSAKFRNIAINPKVAFVVDEVSVENAMEGTHFLEIRGWAEQIRGIETSDPHLDSVLIRIHPTRVISWNVDTDGLVFESRDIDTPRREVA